MQRVGIVYIAKSDWPGEPRFTGYWDRYDPPAMIEQAPGWDDLHDAVAWGNERAPRVMIRFGVTEDTIYSAGEIRLTRHKDGSGTAYPVWP